MKRILGAAIVFGLLIGTGESNAATLTFFGTDAGNGGAGVLTSGERVNSDAAHTQWLSYVLGAQTETFESLTVGGPLPVPLVGFAATVNGTGTVSNAIPASGRYPTSGQKYFEAGSEPSASIFSITFGTSVAALGFYGIDMFDFQGGLALLLTRESGATETRLLPVNNALVNGNLLFWGLVETDLNPDNWVKSLTFLVSNTGQGGDFFGVDDFSVGAFNPAAVPEPGSLLLLGTGVVALARRRRSKQAN